MTKRRVVLIIVVCFILYLSFYQLGKAPLENWDEAWYGEATKEMLRTKDFIVLHWNHNVWLDKPPLYIWLSTLFSSMFGLSEFSLRLTSAISGAIIMLLVVVYSYRNYGVIPSALAFSAIAFNNLFLWRTRSGNIDVFVALLIFVSYFLTLSKQKYKYPLLGIVFASIYLTKASLVLFPVIIFLVYEFLYNRKKILHIYKEYIKLFLLFFSLAGIWLLLGYFKVGHEFLTYYLFNSDQGVADLMKFNPDYISYAYYSLQRRFFWVFLLGTIFAIISIKKPQNFLLLCYSWLLLLQLSFTERSNNWYLIPSIPFWALLIAYGTERFLVLVRKNIIVIVVILLLSSYVSYKTFVGNIMPLLDHPATSGQTESSNMIKQLTKSDEVIVRLDYLYPATIYYADRKVLASPDGLVSTNSFWITRNDLIQAVSQKKIKWLVGPDAAVQAFQKQASMVKFTVIKVNSEDTILEVL
jgi:4-amino-4-deoxy-L-arabinose transferase-like glycosyltransferase